MKDMPYLAVQDPQIMMKGKGAPRSTVFGVLGRTKETGYMRSLGGLVTKTTAGSRTPAHMSEKEAMRRGLQTERDILGPASKTGYPKQHYSQVPYVGQFASHLGKEL